MESDRLKGLLNSVLELCHTVEECLDPTSRVTSSATRIKNADPFQYETIKKFLVRSIIQLKYVCTNLYVNFMYPVRKII